MKTGTQGRAKSKTPLRRNKSLEADYYNAQRAKTAALTAKRPRGHGNKASDERKQQIADLINLHLPRYEVLHRAKTSWATYEDVLADMRLGKFGGLK